MQQAARLAMGLILETSILIAIERGRFDLRGFLQARAPDEIVGMSAVTVSELLHGAERGRRPEQKERRRRFVEKMVAQFQTHSFGLAEARVHARIGASLAESGQMIGAHDLLIAATCLHLNAHLATLNTVEFARIPGLKLIETTPYTR